MQDWKQIAVARALDIPEPQLDKIRPTLEALDSAFQRIRTKVPYGIQPVVLPSRAPEKDR